MQDDSLLRAEIEARVLSGQSSREIGETLGFSTESVEFYEEWFFDVRERCPNYVLYQLLQLHTFEDWWDTGTIWKFWGYKGGPLVLDAVMHEFNPVDKPNSVSEVGAFLERDLLQRLRIRVMVLLNMLPINERTAPKMLRLFSQIQRLEALKPPILVGVASVNVQAFFEGLPKLGEGENLQTYSLEAAQAEEG